MQKLRRYRLGQAMTNLGRTLGTPLRQIGAMVGPDAVLAYADEYRARGFAVVFRSWGAEVYSKEKA